MRINRTFAAVLLLLTACSSSTQEVETPTSLAGCYVAQVGEDQAFLELAQSRDQVSGVLEYAFAQKDNTWGIIAGPVTTESLTLEYQYFSEGVLSVREVTLTRSAAELVGEGFTFKPTDSCGMGMGWSVGEVTQSTVDTFHDPETGYYARAHFTIDGPAEGYAYRCVATVSDSDGLLVTRWIGSGATDKSNAARKQNIQTNITPDQVKSVKTVDVQCQVKLTN